MSMPLPSRFQPRLPTPAERWRFRLLLGRDGMPTPAQVQAFGEQLMVGDPLDAQVAAWADTVGFAQSRALIDRALDGGIQTVPEAPAFVRELFEQIDREPLWLDWELLERGQRAISRTGIVGGLVMRDAALMGGYANAAINKPLVFTGALAQSAARRTSETRAFAIDVSQPGALRRQGRGFKTTVRVRFLHALLRHRIRQHPQWQEQDWGVPINQADMLATNLAFSVAYMTGMRVLGFRFSREERAGILHLWRYVGYLMGIDERILVSEEREGLRILCIALTSQPGADEDTRRLALALMNEPYEMAGEGRLGRLWAEAQVRLHNGVSHFFLGSEAYRELGLPAGRRWSWMPLALMPVVASAETLRQLTPFGDELFVRAGQAWRQRWIKQLLAGQAAGYQPVSTLARDR